tara:strand:- start:17 stop:712 length:696 start_codon:yes stop_codon:yes gene_type:complete
MQLENVNKIIFIHGWLFGSYIWRSLQEYFPNTISKEFISLPGYDNISADKSRTDVIHTLLRCAKKDDVIIGYSYTATTILFSNELAKCQASIFLVNPFLKAKSNSITALRDNLKEDFDSAVKKFIFECVKGNVSSKRHFTILRDLFYKNDVPDKNLLISELEEMMFIDRSKLIVNSNDNLTILLSDQDEICDAQIINKFIMKKVKILSLENSPHFPFFDPNEIFKTIGLTS